MTSQKKLIEVALPLESINQESKHEKDVKVGKPLSLHHWWARRPMAASRAAIFASLIDDPSGRPDKFPTQAEQERERRRLFGLLEELVRWESSSDPRVIDAARAAVRDSTEGEQILVVDPFCGGGTIPLESQRLGLETHASDLNPLAVLITQALTEIPARFVGFPAVNPDARRRQNLVEPGGLHGLIADVEHYSAWIRSHTWKQIGHYFPEAPKVEGQHGDSTPVVAWIWARTISCPNPACTSTIPLVRSFHLSVREGREVWVEPRLSDSRVLFRVHVGKGAVPPGTVDRRGASCLACGSHVPFSHIRAEGRSQRIGRQLMAIVAEGDRQRRYLNPSPEHEEIAASIEPHPSAPSERLPEKALGFRVQAYGMSSFADLFTPRQLMAMCTFSDCVPEAREQVIEDGKRAGLADNGKGYAEGGSGIRAYADIIALYLAFCVDRVADWGNALCHWENKAQVPQQLLGQQTVSMAWDFAESNPFSRSTGSWDATARNVIRSLKALPANTFQVPQARVRQLDATASLGNGEASVVITDPPYYDNIGYADLSDFFYVWLRRAIGGFFPDVLSTLLTPKSEEIIAAPERFGGDKEKARRFFEEGLQRAFELMRRKQHPSFPLTLYYAFKQAEGNRTSLDAIDAIISTGWETMLSGLIKAGFRVTGTWPMRTEMGSRRRGIGANALASSILIVCRARPEDAVIATRQEFLRALRAELPDSLRNLQHGNIAPVDLAQASIGPGMAVFSRFSKVVEADGTAMRVGTALGIINQVLSEVLTEQEEQYDPQTRWAVAWFEQHGMNEGLYGDAELLSKAKATALEAMTRDGFVKAKGGKVALLPRADLPQDWDPVTDPRLTIWEATQNLTRVLEKDGEKGAARQLRRLGPATGETARDLAYRLYVVCERKKWTEEALAYNSLVVAWPEIVRLATEGPVEVQESLLGE